MIAQVEQVKFISPADTTSQAGETSTSTTLLSVEIGEFTIEYHNVDVEAMKRRIAEITPSAEDFREYAKNNPPPDAWLRGDDNVC